MRLRLVPSVVSFWGSIIRVAGIFLMAACATFLQAKGDLSGIIAVASADIRNNPNDAAAYLRRGNAGVEEGDFDGAIADFNEFIRLKPNDASSYVSRGEMKCHKGDIDGAITDESDAIRLNSNLAVAYSDRGSFKEFKGDLNGAIADYNEAIRCNPNDAETYSNRGLVKQAKGDPVGAMVDEAEAIRLNPKSANAYNNLAWLRAVSPDGKFRNGLQAVEYARKACELSGWKDEGYIDTLAAAYAEVGNFDEAVKWQTECLKFKMPKEEMDQCRQRLALYEQKKPYREESTHK
jgi:tetratricopeptide (TPR) repeat protein